jgi:hypothetical protein
LVCGWYAVGVRLEVQGRSVGSGRKPRRATWAAVSHRPAQQRLAAPWRAREPIFCETRTIEFCGIRKSAPQPAGPCEPLHPGRWVCEKGGSQGGRGWAFEGLGGWWCALPISRWVVVRICGRELASPFFAKPAQLSFAGSGNPPHSPPARASHCTQAGGYVRERESQAPAGGMSRHAPWHLSAAAFAGRCWSRFILRRPRVVPYGLPGYRRLRRAPPQHRRWPLALRRPAAAKASGKTPHGVREYPMCAEGWALWVLGGSPYLPQSHRGYLPVGDAFRAEPPGRASSWGA